jgi:PST family polysaccharide transporter
VGLPYGGTGVAAAYSIVMLLWALPAITWVVHDTPLSVRDILLAVSRPLCASVLGAACAMVLRLWYGEQLPAFFQLVLESSVLFSVFAGTLLFPMRQRAFYLDIIRPWRRALSIDKEPRLASEGSTYL